MKENNLIIGCGDTGKRVFKQLETRNSTNSVTSHNKASQNQLKKIGIPTISANLDVRQTLGRLPTENANIFYFVPPAPSGISDTRMLNFIQSLDKKTPPNRMVYISTTGVYGDCQGQWITESAKLSPQNDRSKRRLHAESAIQDYCATNSCEFVILRVTGIYCLEKLPLERIINGIKILSPELAPASNRIHADDLTNCCIKAMFEGPANEIFNIADGHPSSISDYFIQIANLFQLPKPELLNWAQAEQTLSPAMLSYLHESKKVNIDKLKNNLKIKFAYPTLIDGLQSCYQEQNKNL